MWQVVRYLWQHGCIKRQHMITRMVFVAPLPKKIRFKGLSWLCLEAGAPVCCIWIACLYYHYYHHYYYYHDYCWSAYVIGYMRYHVLLCLFWKPGRLYSEVIARYLRDICKTNIYPDPVWKPGHLFCLLFNVAVIGVLVLFAIDMLTLLTFPSI